MIAYTTSAQAILKAKIARLERILAELREEQHRMQERMTALATLQQRSTRSIHDDP